VPRAATQFRCSACGATSGRWFGRCPKCGEFSTLAEEAPAPATPGLRSSARAAAPTRPARRVSDVVTGGPVRRMLTGIGEFDRVLGGGLVAGQVCLCSGPPGSGKSTLLLAVADAVARRTDRPVLYVSGEESVEQIGVRAGRIGADSPQLLIADDTELGAVIGHVQAQPDLALVIVDSVQTVASTDVEGRAGGVTQTMEVAQALTRVAKSTGIPMMLIGQVTKDSTVAGPRALEHIVDTTLRLDGDKHTSLRVLRTVKNRFGSLEVAAFEQTDAGMREVHDPSSLFREHRDAPVPGTCVAVTMEGQRPLTAEIQSLVAPTTNPNPRRGVSGLDAARSAMLIAISERAARLRLHDKDVYLATVAGMRVSDPSTDLAVCLAVVSAAQNQPVPIDLIAIGEVALSGDVRPVPMLAERAVEAARLGFQRLLVPVGSRARLDGHRVPAQLVEVANLDAAIAAMQRAGLSSVRKSPLTLLD
jgi:DNA repair protein RadA/Sms